MMIFLDTHVIVWLYEGKLVMIPDAVQQQINNNHLCISPAVELELEFLFEINRIQVRANEIIEYLDAHLGLSISDISFHRVVEEAKTIKWTRDSFDRMIVANASIFQLPLITKDSLILKNYEFGQWKIK